MRINTATLYCAGVIGHNHFGPPFNGFTAKQCQNFIY